MSKRICVALAALGAVGLLAFAPAFAAEPGGKFAEPNDTAGRADGPLAGGREYESWLDDGDDVDFLYFATSFADSRLRIVVRNTTPNCAALDRCVIYARLYTQDGDGAGFTEAIAAGSAGTMDTRMAEIDNYYIAVNTNDGERTYSVHVDVPEAPPGAAGGGLQADPPPPATRVPIVATTCCASNAPRHSSGSTPVPGPAPRPRARPAPRRRRRDQDGARAGSAGRGTDRRDPLRSREVRLHLRAGEPRARHRPALRRPPRPQRAAGDGAVAGALGRRTACRRAQDQSGAPRRRPGARRRASAAGAAGAGRLRMRRRSDHAWPAPPGTARPHGCARPREAARQGPRARS